MPKYTRSNERLSGETVSLVEDLRRVRTSQQSQDHEVSQSDINKGRDRVTVGLCGRPRPNERPQWPLTRDLTP